MTQSKLNNNTRAINFSLSVDQSDNQKISHQPINQCQSINQSIQVNERISLSLFCWLLERLILHELRQTQEQQLQRQNRETSNPPRLNFNY